MRYRHFWILLLFILIGYAYSQNIFATLTTPTIDGITACDDRNFILSVVLGGDESKRILVLEPAPYFNESPTGDFPADWGRFIDTLSIIGFDVDIVDISADITIVLPDYDVLIVYGDPGRAFFASEITAIQTHLNSGGGVLSIVRAASGDLSEIPIHDPVINIVGMNYDPPRLSLMDTISAISGTHPILSGVAEITTYKPLPITAPADQQVIFTGTGECIVAADSSSGGRLVAFGDEHFIHNGPLVFGGIPVDWDAADHKTLTITTILWLASGRESPGCGLDTASSNLDIDGFVYDFSAPEMDWDGFNLSFTPLTGFWTSGSHDLAFYLADSCGHSLDFALTVDFDVDPPRFTLLDPPSGILSGSGDTALFYIHDYESILDVETSFIVIDGMDTLWLPAIAVGTDSFGVVPLTGWAVGSHEICIYALDAPDYCAPNILDTCGFIELLEETLWVEVADIWVEGCSLVYTEVCVRSADRYVKDLDLDNFDFFENGIEVVPPSLEQLNFCFSESMMVDIVLLFDFSTSMDDEVWSFFGAIPSFVAALGAMDYQIAAVVFNGCLEDSFDFDPGTWRIIRTNFAGACTYSEFGPDWWASDLTEFNCLYDAVINHYSTAGWRGSGNEDQFGAIVSANENLDFRPYSIKSFILFTDERPIVDDPPCEPAWDETPEGLDSIIQYCNDNDIMILPVTPHNGEFEYYAPDEGPERMWYEGYYDLGPQTNGEWFYLYSDDYDTLATQIGEAIANIPCCYLFRYREDQFCNDLNSLVVDAFYGGTNYGRGDTIYEPPCPGFAEVVYPDSCGGITTCEFQEISIEMYGNSDEFAPVESTLSVWVTRFGIFDLDDTELEINDSILHFIPSSGFSNWDTVWSTLASGFDSIGCPIFSDTCHFIVDIQPPLFFELYPPPDTVMETTDITISVMIYDSLAGVRWSEVGADNFEVSVDGIPVPVSIYSDHPYMHISGIELHNLDSITVCINDIPDDPTFDYCPPNLGDTCWDFSILILEGPIADIVLPDSGIISACIDQEIWIAITDSDGVNASTIVLVINEDTFTCADSQLDYRDDTLFFTPDAGYWSDGEVVTVRLIKADDVIGVELQNPLEWTFALDFAPPLAQMTEPEDSGTVIDLQQPILIDISDNLAGIHVVRCSIIVAGLNFPLGSILTSISSDSLAANAIIDPEQLGEMWLPGDTINVDVYLCDNPDTCGPNCSEFHWVFYLPPGSSCARMPNPFTPNTDGFNDYCQFTFPGLYFKDASIHIYDIHGVKIREVSVDMGMSAKEISQWDGKDKKGKWLPNGLYVFLIEVDSEIVCEGTVTIAR